MKIIDTHCDALYKMQLEKRMNKGLIDYRTSPILDTNLERLQAGNVIVQFFAIFIKPNIPSDEVWEYALEQIALFNEEVIGKNREMVHIKNWEQLEQIEPGKIGAVLTLEGAEAIGNDLNKLHHLYKEGILSIGLTWNSANLCADGVGEERNGGLTALRKQVVQLNNEHQVFTDVSHLSVNGFWDVMALAKYPFASHSNTVEFCDHRRTLNNEQIEAMFQNNGLIHVVLYPVFIKAKSEETVISDLIRHIDHLCSLGGVQRVGFGSDFDGIDNVIKNLENSSMFPNLINELLKRYSEDEVRGFAYQNFLDNLPNKR